MQATACGRDALRGVEARRAADDNDIHGAMLQEGVEVLFIHLLRKFTIAQSNKMRMRIPESFAENKPIPNVKQ